MTWSAHYIGDRRFRSAVRDYLVREGAGRGCLRRPGPGDTCPIAPVRDAP